MYCGVVPIQLSTKLINMKLKWYCCMDKYIFIVLYYYASIVMMYTHPLNILYYVLVNSQLEP